jgi:hypothetical protein
MSTKKAISEACAEHGWVPDQGVFRKPFSNFLRSIFEYWRLIVKVDRPLYVNLVQVRDTFDKNKYRNKFCKYHPWGIIQIT